MMIHRCYPLRNTPTGGGAGMNSVYRLPTCHISVATQSLVDLAYATLDEMRGATGGGYSIFACVIL